MNANGSSGLRGGRGPGLLPAAALAFLLGAGACAPASEAEEPSGITEASGDSALGQALAAGCALASVEGNGLASNGLTSNGLCQNGLALQGLTLAGLSTPSFVTWFNIDPALSNVVMRYVYRCAAPAKTSITWKNPVTNAKYTWAGGLGLATDWVGGAAATVAEQQVVTACLAALTNKFGISVTIAVEGRTASGARIAVTASELTTFSEREACFFGNLFGAEGVYSAIDHSMWPARLSSARACAFDTTRSGSPVPDCPPMFFVGACADFCTQDATRTFYESCSYNGQSYLPLSTRIRPSDIYRCGDDVCQISERCGTGTAWYDCADCKPCP